MVQGKRILITVISILIVLITILTVGYLVKNHLDSEENSDNSLDTEENDIDEELVEMLITKAEKYARNTLGQKCTGTYLGKSKSYENPQYILIGCVNDANTLSVIYMMEHANGEWIPHSIRICSGDNAKDAFNTKVYININTN